MANYFDYEFAWCEIKKMVEEFNVKFNYGFHIEPFLTGSEELIGIFSDYGLFIFFEIDNKQLVRFQVTESRINKVVIKINPNLMIPYKDFELILLNYSISLSHYKEKRRRQIKYATK